VVTLGGTGVVLRWGIVGVGGGSLIPGAAGRVGFHRVEGLEAGVRGASPCRGSGRFGSPAPVRTPRPCAPRLGRGVACVTEPRPQGKRKDCGNVGETVNRINIGWGGGVVLVQGSDRTSTTAQLRLSTKMPGFAGAGLGL